MKLEEFQRQVQGGSLRVRKMTAKAFWRSPAVPAKARRK